MNWADAKAEVSFFLQRRSEVSGDSGVYTTDVERALHHAHTWLWGKVIEHGPTYIYRSSTISYEADTWAGVDLYTKLSARYAAIYYAGILHDSSVAVSVDNPPTRLELRRRTDKDDGHLGAFSTTGIPSMAGSMEAYLLGSKFYLRPVPTTVKSIYLEWAPAEPPKTHADHEEFLDGQLPTIQPTIVYMAARMLAVAKNKKDLVAELRGLQDDLLGPAPVYSHLRRMCQGFQRQQPLQTNIHRYE